jgi:hypothetical protein
MADPFFDDQSLALSREKGLGIGYLMVMDRIVKLKDRGRGRKIIIRY